MQTSDKPSLIPVPFANSGTKNTIPTNASPTPGLASLDTGFPPVTMTPIAAGGIPPAGQDFNGILFLISAVSRWANAGGSYGYDSDFATAIGGYPKGAVLLNSGANGFWMSTADNNTNDPDSGGANWINPLAGRLLGIQTFTSNGTFTPGTYNGIKSTRRYVKMVGGGGAGGGIPATNSTSTALGGGGQGGAYAEFFDSSDLSAGVSITVGAGGSPASPGNASGGAGGSTSFGTLCTCPGGSGGAGGAQSPTGSVASILGAANAPTGSATLLVSLIGNPSKLGVSIIGATSPIQGGSGADTPFGHGGYGSGGGNGGAANGKGAGGGGAGGGASSGSAFAGGSGSPGYIIVLEYA